jgi:hypothetical protein
MTEESTPKPFAALIEIAPQNDEVFGPDVAGGFVRAFVIALDEVDAKERFARALDERELGLVGYEWCVEFDAVDWENADSEEGSSLMAEARSTGEPAFAEFHVWGTDAESEDDDKLVH